MHQLADSSVFWVLAITALVVLYLLPTLIGLTRGVDKLALVFLVNLIGGSAFVGWPAAMILAFGPRRQQVTPGLSEPQAARQEPSPFQLPMSGNQQDGK